MQLQKPLKQKLPPHIRHLLRITIIAKRRTLQSKPNPSGRIHLKQIRPLTSTHNNNNIIPIQRILQRNRQHEYDPPSGLARHLTAFIHLEK